MPSRSPLSEPSTLVMQEDYSDPAMIIERLIATEGALGLGRMIQENRDEKENASPRNSIKGAATTTTLAAAAAESGRHKAERRTEEGGRATNGSGRRKAVMNQDAA
ncbi:Protein of unknown function [Gryllus bimaculatus]|nr:Protein of unknown function [Gryllus bimaculatus]